MPNSFILVIAIIFFVLIAVRLSLPAFALYYSNRFLRKHPTLNGSIGKVSLSLLTGRLKIVKLRIGMKDEASGIDNLVIQIPEVVVTVKLGALMRKKVFMQVSLFRPEVVFANVLNRQEKNNEEIEKKERRLSETKQEKAFVKSPIKKAFENILPFKIDLGIVQGNLRYIDSSSKPQRDIVFENLAFTVQNLSNQKHFNTTPALITANAKLYGGDLNLTVLLQPLEEFLTFDMKMKFEDAALVKLNDYFREYVSVDVHSGSLDVYFELIAMDGSFKGYLQPVFKNIDVIGAEDSNDSIFKKIWERIVATVIQALENNKVDRLSTRIEIEGQLNDPNVNIVTAISDKLKDSFMQAIQKSFQNALSFSSIFRTVFNSTANFIKKTLA